MAERNKPNSAIGAGGGYWHDSDHLTAETRYWLVTHAAASSLDPSQQEQFVARANQLAQTPHDGDEPYSASRKLIAKVEKGAMGLLYELKLLDAESIRSLTISTREAGQHDQSAQLTSNMVASIAKLGATGFLEQSREWVNALRILAEHANSQWKPTTHDKPKPDRARGMVASLAIYYWQLTDKWPPTDDAAWFAKFVRVLGTQMGLHDDEAADQPKKGKDFIGERIVKSGIDLARNPGRDNEE